MQLNGSVQQVWICIGESDQWHGQPLYLAILELLHHEGCAGGTVFRGIAGFGANSRIRTTTLVELSIDLPIVVMFVDQTDRVARVLPTITNMVEEGLITMTPCEVVKYTYRAIKPFPIHLTAADVMTRAIMTVQATMTVGEIVTLLLDAALRAVPVVDDQCHVIGMITDGDLLRRGVLDLPVHIQQSLPLPERAKVVANLTNRPQKATDLMTPHPVTVPDTMGLAQVAHTLVTHDLKRLPVVDQHGCLVGMISSGDLLSTIVEGLRQRPEEPMVLPANAPQVVADVMSHNVPTVLCSTPLAETLDTILQTAQRRAVVVDEQRRVVGIITDGDVLKRAARQIHTSLLRRLADWLSHGTAHPELVVAAKGRVAADVMTAPVTIVSATTPIVEAIRLLITTNVVRMPVVDDDGRLVGIVGRAGLLRALT